MEIKSPHLDPIDQQILAFLEENARRSYSDMARQLGLTSPAIAERIRKLEHHGVIRGYKPVLDKKKLGLGVQAIILVEVRYSDEKQFVQFVRARPEIVSCNHTPGPSAFVLRVELANLDALESLVTEMMRFGQTVTHILMSAVK